MNFGEESATSQNDSQFHFTAGSGTGQFWTGSSYGTVAGVILRSNVAVGQLICSYGRISGSSCGTIASTTSTLGGLNQCNGGPCDNVWIATNGLNLTFGDSGGPSYLGGLAMGLVKGDYTIGGVTRQVINSISYVRARLGVTLIGE